LLRRAIRAAPVELAGRRLEPLSVSVGIAVFPLHGSEPGMLVEAAHKAIAIAKQNGRDRSEVAEVVAPAAGERGA
jgi:GGDEF domain-containing protein